MKKILLILCIGLMLAPLSAYAKKSNIPDYFPSLARGVRPLGMGNAFLTAKGDDHNAQYYNPASIYDRPLQLEWTTGLPIFPVEINPKAITFTKDVIDFAKDVDDQGTTAGKIGTFNTFFNKHVGKYQTLNFQLPILGVGNKFFQASVIADSRTIISLRDRTQPNVQLKHLSLGGLALSGAYGFFFDDLKVGATVKTLYAFEFDNMVTTNDILGQDFKDALDTNRGFGVGFDLGVKYRLPTFDIEALDILSPEVAVTYQDIGNTRFSGGVESIPQSVSAGLGIFPVFGDIETSLLVDFREINQKMDIAKKLHVGTEVWFPKVAGTKFGLRAGMNQLYPSFGFSARFPFATWNVSYYGEEMGQYTRQKGEYRVANEFIWTF